MAWRVQKLSGKYPPAAGGRVGVLLVNLGTPDLRSVKRYLAEFLSDRRVIEIQPIFWQPVLHGIILNTRPRKSAHAYRQIWTEEGSPLAVITARQARLGDCWLTGPCATVLRRSTAGVDELVLWAHSSRAALPTVLRCYKSHGCR